MIDLLAIARQAFRTSDMRLARRVVAASRIKISSGSIDKKKTEWLRGSKLSASNKGDIASSLISAGFHARKMNKDMFIYVNTKGSTGGTAMLWTVSWKPGDYLNPINNSGADGSVMYSVSPDLVVSSYIMERPKLEQQVYDLNHDDVENLKQLITLLEQQGDRQTTSLVKNYWNNPVGYPGELYEQIENRGYSIEWNNVDIVDLTR